MPGAFGVIEHQFPRVLVFMCHAADFVGASKSRDPETLTNDASVPPPRNLGTQASVEYASAQLNDTTVDPPIDGVVSSVSTEDGETVAASFATPIFVTLTDLAHSEMWACVHDGNEGPLQLL